MAHSEKGGPPDTQDELRRAPSGPVRAGSPKRTWTLHLLVGLIAGPLLGAAIFAKTGALDLGLASALMLTMIPVAFGVSALATSHLIRLARLLWDGFNKGLILVASLTGWRPREVPPPNEYVFHLHSPQQALIEGFFGPLNLYFRPSTVFSRHDESYFSFEGRDLLTLFYISSFAWLPISFFVSVMIAGIPSSKTSSLTGTIALLMVLLGFARGFGFSGTKPRRYELYPDFIWFFGVFFAAAFIFDQVLFDQVSQSPQAPFSALAGSARWFFSLFPTFVIGGIMGLAAVLGSLMGARNLIRAAYAVSAFLFVSMLWSSTMRRLDLLLAAVVLALVSTHVAFQPVYILWSAFFGRLATKHPDWSLNLWDHSPARLTEYVYVPQPGTAEVVRRLKDTNPQEAARAIRFLSCHPFQSRLGIELGREWLAEEATLR